MPANKGPAAVTKQPIVVECGMQGARCHMGFMMSAAALLLVLLCTGHSAALAVAAQQGSSSSSGRDACEWSPHIAADQQRCPAEPWYSIPSCPAQAGIPSNTAQVSVQPASSLDVANTTQPQQPAVEEHSAVPKQLYVSESSAGEAHGPRQVYIVRFSQYQMLAELKQVLEEVRRPMLVA
jgi:hypothetical protein